MARAQLISTKLDDVIDNVLQGIHERETSVKNEKEEGKFVVRPMFVEEGEKRDSR